MGKQNRNQILNGYFFEGEYYEYDSKNKVHKDPILIRFKQNDAGTQGVSSGGKRTTMVQDSQAREVYKKSVTIRVYNDLPYKPYDNFRIVGEDTIYTIKDVVEDYQSTNSISNLRFKNKRNNKTYVLVMGER